MFSSIQSKEEFKIDQLPEPTPIEKFEKEREDFYRKRNLEVYGNEDYIREEPEQVIEPEKPQIPEEVIYEEIPVKVRPIPKKEYYRKKYDSGQAENNLNIARIIFLISSVGWYYALYNFTKSTYKPFTEFSRLKKKIIDDHRVEEVSTKRLKGEKEIFKIVLKEGKQMSYENLEDILLPRLQHKPRNFDQDMSKKSAILGIIWAFSMYVFVTAI